MSNQTEYEAILPIAQTITKDEFKSINMPIGIFAQEAEDLFIWSAHDKEALIEAGIPEEYFLKLNQCAGALRYAQSHWVKDFKDREDAEQRWAEESPAAFDLVNELIHTFRYAYRNNDIILKQIAAIAEGSGAADMIQDLSDLSILGNENKAELEGIKFDFVLLDEASATSAAMADLRAMSNGEKLKASDSMIIRDQMYTLLKRYVDEIRSCGKYLFWRNSDRLRGYSSEYKRKQYLRNKKKETVS